MIEILEAFVILLVIMDPLVGSSAMLTFTKGKKIRSVLGVFFPGVQ